jgi:hypothetical protein
MERIAFYPCCANDIRQPALALTGIADEIIYCDISRSLRDDPALVGGIGPKRLFWRKDIREALEQIPRIDVFFYRRDGTSEGGSGIFVLGRDIMPLILAKMTSEQGLFITDGSNSRGGTFRKMQKKFRADCLREAHHKEAGTEVPVNGDAGVRCAVSSLKIHRSRTKSRLPELQNNDHPPRNHPYRTARAALDAARHRPAR